MKLLFAALFVVMFCGLARASDSLPELRIEKIAEDVYLHTSFQQVEGYGLVDANGLVVLGGQGAYIIDTPWSERDTAALVAWLKERNYQVKASVSTHFHDDRTAGIEYLNAISVPTYASARTNALLKQNDKALATETFDDAPLWLLEGKVEVFYPGAGHSVDNLVVWLSERKLLNGGCFVRAAAAGTLGNTADAVVSEWAASAERLQRRYPDAQLVIPGHGVPGDVSLLEHTRKLAVAATAKD
ncbi:PST family subclass B1 metallo-beta-lactamase [Stutzerimonas nitrititolerans]|uniref:PST family subclass B1 metallo-beta-lactamase n=1 Tax=Stutzerimonas nitrititolerans TaxID=2482751 RepID=UPI0028A5CDB4|nr:PST family subclass B1 metallo-beta-lactamase [Stutzerimonas nitrititolerans]